MQAVILAGGRGTRLGALTQTIPKPLITVRGKPFLEWILLSLSQCGVKSFVLCTGYLQGQIADYFGNGSRWRISISYSAEDEPLGTGGAIFKAEKLIRGPFLVLNGDTHNDIDYRDMWSTFEKHKIKGLILVSEDPDRCYSKNLTVDRATWRVKEYGDEPASARNYLDCGVKILSKEIFSFRVPKPPFSLESEVLNLLAREGSLMAYPTDRIFFDIGTPERLRRAEELLPVSHTK